MREARFAAKTRRCTCEQHRAASQGHEPARRLASHEEAAKKADAPELLEGLGGQFAKIDLLVYAGVVSDEVGRLPSNAWRHRAIEEANHVRFDGRIDRNRFGAAAGFLH